MDDDAAKVESLGSGRVPFYEPGLQELVDEGRAAGRLTFTGDLRAALDGTEIAFVCVGTPGLADGAPNLAYVERVGRDAAVFATNDLVLVEKSTVPANTGVRLSQIIQREQARTGSPEGADKDRVRIEVASNPEFLREGSAVSDTLHPDRIVIGSATPDAGETVRRVYEPMLADHDCPVVMTDLPTAELIKHASNAFLATRISFINAVAQICEQVGADVTTVAQGMGYDKRIGPHFLNAGLGYGGSCFPKDVAAFHHLSESVGYEFRLLDAVRQINGDMRRLVMDKLRSEVWHLQDKTVTLLGAAFKPGTDDLREAPALYLLEQLLDEGATVRVYDPVATGQVKERYPQVEVFEDPIEALTDAHAAIVCTEWDQVRALTPAQMVAALGYPIVIDGRNVFDPQAMEAAGVAYHGIGRGSPQ